MIDRFKNENAKNQAKDTTIITLNNSLAQA